MVVRKALPRVAGHGHIRDQERDYVLGLELDPEEENLGWPRKAVADSPVLALEGGREIAGALAGEVCYTPRRPEEGQGADSNHPGHPGVEEGRQSWVGVADREAEDSPAEEALHKEGTGVLRTKVSDCVMRVFGRDIRLGGWYGLYDIFSRSVNR